MGQRLTVCSKLKPIGEGAAKASLNRAPSGNRDKLHAVDPKPDDLSMVRLKAG